MPAASQASSPSPASAAPSTGFARRRRRRQADESTGALQLAEEAFQLLRTTPAAGLWAYYAGTVPFVLAVFYFWADMSRSSHAQGDAALGSLALALAYFWMKGWQGWFCRRLWHQLHPSGDSLNLSKSRFLRHLAAQVFLHAFALPVRLLSLAFIGWTYAFFQNVSVLAFTQDYGRQPLRRIIQTAGRFAHQGWGQNYLVLLLMSVIGFFVWLNVMGAVALVPMALKMFFGIETPFTLNPESTLLNTTFLFASLLLTFLVVDPMMKAIYTLRCFKGVSRTTGADLLSRLLRVGPAALLAGLLALGPISEARSQEGGPEAPATISADDLRHSIDETLRQKEYQWRYPRLDQAGETDAEKGWLARKLTDLADSIDRFAKRIGDAIEDFFKTDRPRARQDQAVAPGFGAGIGLAAQTALVVVIVALIAWVVILLVRRAAREKVDPAEDAAPAGPIDLESDAIVATQLPEDEWMRLAREQIAKGEHRLAVRALFLASLAHLGDRGLLNVARFKSNRDYSRELVLKARALPELRNAFGENVGLFERVWYGLHEIGRDAIDRFTANYERITRPTAPPQAGDPAIPAPPPSVK